MFTLDLSHVALFVGAATLLLLTPGPVVLYVVARSMNQGRSAGFVSALSAGVGDLCHVLAATLGLSALLLSSALAFTVVKYAGAAYLIYLGVRTLLSREPDAAMAAPKLQPLSRVFGQGVLVSVLNPKTALFFLAFLPQFVHPEQGHVGAQVFVLGVIFVVLGVITNCGYAILAGGAAHLLRSNPRFLKGQRYMAGSIYVGLGVTTALSGSSK